VFGDKEKVYGEGNIAFFSLWSKKVEFEAFEIFGFLLIFAVGLVWEMRTRMLSLEFEFSDRWGVKLPLLSFLGGFYKSQICKKVLSLWVNFKRIPWCFNLLPFEYWHVGFLIYFLFIFFGVIIKRPIRFFFFLNILFLQTMESRFLWIYDYFFAYIQFSVPHTLDYYIESLKSDSKMLTRVFKPRISLIP